MDSEIAMRLGHADRTYLDHQRAINIAKLAEALNAVQTLDLHLKCLEDESNGCAQRALVEVRLAFEDFIDDNGGTLKLAMTDLETGADE